MILYTADSVRLAIVPKWNTYYAKLAVGQSPTWICDQRGKDLFCLHQWLIDELTQLGCQEPDRGQQLRFFNRKARAYDDLYDLAAQAVNGFLTGNIDTYRGRG